MDIQNENNVLGGRGKQEVIHLKNELGFMRKRKREFVLRTNKVKLTTDPEKYYHSLLMLYLSWLSEESLKGGFETYADHYKNVSHIVDHNATYFNHNSDHIDNAIDAYEENKSPPETEEENINTLQDGYLIHHIDNSKCEVNYKDTCELGLQYTMEVCKDIMSPSQYRGNVRKLNPGQRKIVMYNRAWCKGAVIAARKGQAINGYHLILSGPGGTGKSHVINLI